MGKLSKAKGLPRSTGSHHARTRRRAYPTAGSMNEPREGREYGRRGNARRNKGGKK